MPAEIKCKSSCVSNQRARRPHQCQGGKPQEFGRQSVAEGVDGWADQIARDVQGDVEAWADQFNSDAWSSEFAAAANSAAGGPFPP